jgi:hypothetical protein
MTWLENVRCACGADDWMSIPAPEGIHTITECREPDPERFCATSCGFGRTGHGHCKPLTPPSVAQCCGPCSRGQHAVCDGNEYAVCECPHSLSIPSAEPSGDER